MLLRYDSVIKLRSLPQNSLHPRPVVHTNRLCSRRKKDLLPCEICPFFAHVTYDFCRMPWPKRATIFPLSSQLALMKNACRYDHCLGGQLGFVASMCCVIKFSNTANVLLGHFGMLNWSSVSCPIIPRCATLSLRLQTLGAHLIYP